MFDIFSKTLQINGDKNGWLKKKKIDPKNLLRKRTHTRERKNYPEFTYSRLFRSYGSDHSVPVDDIQTAGLFVNDCRYAAYRVTAAGIVDSPRYRRHYGQIQMSKIDDRSKHLYQVFGRMRITVHAGSVGRRIGTGRRERGPIACILVVRRRSHVI